MSKEWLLDNQQINIIDVYKSQIVKEQKPDGYFIEFRKNDLSVVSVLYNKRAFDFPEKIGIGSYFYIVFYIYLNQVKIGLWPDKKYWNKGLLLEGVYLESIKNKGE
jgi:hypothetical protein